jgi:hypothetical protein
LSNQSRPFSSSSLSSSILLNCMAIGFPNMSTPEAAQCAPTPAQWHGKSRASAVRDVGGVCYRYLTCVSAFPRCPLRIPVLLFQFLCLICAPTSLFYSFQRFSSHVGHDARSKDNLSAFQGNPFLDPTCLFWIKTISG